MATYEPFIGFEYNGIHSSDLKIYRVSSGNRYDENITAAMTDKVVDVPGGDGRYFFGTTFKNRTFKVDYAFDNLTKEEIRIIKQKFCGDGIHDLIFDEDRDSNDNALKTWSAKVTGTATMKHLCFDEDGREVYKGEGSITFTCYFPYAKGQNKSYSSLASGQKWANDGDIPAPFKARFTYKNRDTSQSTNTFIGITYAPKADMLVQVLFSHNKIVKYDETVEYKWDSGTGLILERKRDNSWEVVPIKNSAVYKVPVGETVWRTANHPFHGIGTDENKSSNFTV